MANDPAYDAVIPPVYDEAGNVIETHEHAGDFKRNRQSTGTEIRLSGFNMRNERL
jgi:hypothetical protein